MYAISKRVRAAPEGARRPALFPVLGRAAGETLSKTAKWACHFAAHAPAASRTHS